MNRRLYLFALASLTLPAALAQSERLTQGPHRLEITLEKKEASGWRTVDPGLVFEHNDLVRFRVRANFDGYLYVMNQSTSGRYSLLFPSEEAGTKNRMEAGRDYLVPATQGWFRIAGPPGHEVVYWLASPLELPGEEGVKPYVPLPPPPEPGKIPPNITPRCDDTILRARGDCVDTSAGAKPVGSKDRLPENLAGVPRAASRDLLFVRRPQASVVASPAGLQGPVVFEFRLAHR
ncbi:MAG TPA: DUF4384 domain-containing protein [Bryobacterales bacterium]|nr:DUF4384 domain-containing protein [Bryobacterales bacterium]